MVKVAQVNVGFVGVDLISGILEQFMHINRIIVVLIVSDFVSKFLELKLGATFTSKRNNQKQFARVGNILSIRFVLT